MDATQRNGEIPVNPKCKKNPVLAHRGWFRGSQYRLLLYSVSRCSEFSVSTQCLEQVRIQNFFTIRPNRPLDKSILYQLTGLNIIQRHQL